MYTSSLLKLVISLYGWLKFFMETNILLKISELKRSRKFIKKKRKKERNVVVSF